MKVKLQSVFIITLVVAVLALFNPITTFIVNSEEAPIQKEPVDMQKADPEKGLIAAVENDGLILYFDNKTGGIAVEEKSSGEMFYSNPMNAQEDTKASEAAKQQLMSQVELVYNIKGKEGDLNMNSYTQAILLEQVSWGEVEKGIRVAMTIGRAEQRLLLPQQIGKTSFEENILVNIESAREKKQIEAFYILNAQADVPNANEDVYVLKKSANDRDKRLLEGYIKGAGYTFEMLEADYTTVGFVPDDTAFPSFAMNIDYVLEDNSLSVDLNVGEIIYDKETFNLISLSLLNYFGAGETGEDGYIFLPDGSGTLIGFNNDGTKKTLLTTGKMYGEDSATTLFERGSFKQDFRFPVFGIQRGDSTLLAIIDDGDAVANINGMLGGINHSWNTAYANFTIKNKDRFIEENAFEQAPWIIYEKKAFNGNIGMKYYFLTGDDADYVGMAKIYREYLVNKGTLDKASVNENIPFYMETMGSVDMIVRKLGIPMSTQVPITTFEQAEDMMSQLLDDGVSNIKLRYKGWYNGGIYYTAPSKMKIERVLGGTKGLAKLSKNALAMGAEVYPDVDFVYVATESMFDGFSPHRDSIRNLFQKSSYFAELDLSALEYFNRMWCITPNRIPEYYGKFTKAYDRMDIPSISLSTMGKGLNSDFKNNNQINRQESMDYITGVLNDASESYGNIISDYGNAYVFPYTDHLLNLPEEDSSFLISDKQVPFIQIALHGYISYAGEPLNLANEVRPAMLKAIEYGSGAYFMLNYGENSILKSAGIYNQRSSMHFPDWEDDAVAIYTRMNEALNDVQDQVITNHEEVADQVFRTTYENGKSIIVNYNEQSVTVEEITVEPLDFAIKVN